MDLDLEDDIAPLLDNDFLSDFLRDVQNLRGVSQNES